MSFILSFFHYFFIFINFPPFYIIFFMLSICSFFSNYSLQYLFSPIFHHFNFILFSLYEYIYINFLYFPFPYSLFYNVTAHNSDFLLKTFNILNLPFSSWQYSFSSSQQLSCIHFFLSLYSATHVLVYYIFIAFPSVVHN